MIYHVILYCIILYCIISNHNRLHSGTAGAAEPADPHSFTHSARAFAPAGCGPETGAWRSLLPEVRSQSASHTNNITITINDYYHYYHCYCYYFYYYYYYYVLLWILASRRRLRPLPPISDVPSGDRRSAGFPVAVISASDESVRSACNH